MSLLISLLVFVLVLAIVVWIVQMLPLPAPWNRIALAIVGVIALLYLLEHVGVFTGHVVIR
jgi:hypothetical protein